VDEFALMPTETATAAADGEVCIVIPGKSEEMKERCPPLCEATGRPKKTRALIYKYKKTPITFYQVIALGVFLLLLILACVAVETWISGSKEDAEEARNHSEEDEKHFRDLVAEVNGQTTSWKAKYNRFASRSKAEDS
ncbi:hypothetical protein PFISCL1PPCAC_24300, partial [Pristionchus fissidentatus]